MCASEAYWIRRNLKDAVTMKARDLNEMLASFFKSQLFSLFLEES